MWSVHVWSGGIIHGARIIAGIKFNVTGQEHLKVGAAIICSKHQSAWETMFFSYYLKNPIFVLKKELKLVPVIGAYMDKVFISIDRAKGTESLKKIVKRMADALPEKPQLIIFPEGTRMPPGVKGEYNRGYLYIYKESNLPIIPVALNSGHCWPRNSFIKHAGTIEVHFLPIIPPAQDRKQVAEQVETAIESEMAGMHSRDKPPHPSIIESDVIATRL